MPKMTDQQRRVQNRRICRAAMLTLPDKEWTVEALKIPFEELTPGEVRESDLVEAINFNIQKGYVSQRYDDERETTVYQLNNRGIAKATNED